MKNPKAQIIRIKHVLDTENSEFLHYYDEDQDEFVYAFFDDLEIDGDLQLDWEGYGDAKNFAEGFCARHNIRSGWIVDSYEPLMVDGAKVENPVKKAGIVPNDIIHTINGHPVLTPDGDTDNKIVYAGSPKQVEVEYTHLGEACTTILEPCYINGSPRLSIQVNYLHTKESPELHGICVFGNLKVNGSIVNRMLEGGPMLYVSGNLEADNLIAGGSFVEVKGTTTVKHYVYGHYNDGMMRLDKVVAKAVISMDHDLSYGEFSGLELDVGCDIDESFGPKYDDAIDAMLDGADMIEPVEEE